MQTSVRDDGQHAGFARYFVYAHLHAGVDSAYDHIHFVTLHQFVGVFHAFGRLGLVVHFEIFNLATAEFVAFFFQSHAKTVVAGQSQLGEGAGVGKHHAYADFGVLRACRQHQAGGGRAQNGSGSGQYLSARGHGILRGRQGFRA